MSNFLRQTDANQTQKSIPDIWFFLFAMLLVLFSSTKSNAQNISFNNAVPASLMVCAAEETFTVSFTNNTGSTLSSVSLNVDFPSGITYASGSLAETSSFNVQEQNISNLSAVVFSMNSIPAGGVVNFNINASAAFAAFEAQNNSTVFLNTITVQHSAGSAFEETDSYNILYPALSVTNINPMSATAFVGQTFTRTVTIVNGGYGSLSSFEVKEIDDANLQLDAVDIGVLNVGTSTFTLSANDFLSIGNNDNSFDQNESITITQTLTALGCNSTQSNITAYWGCDGESSASNSKYPYVTINLFAPNLAITPQPSFNTCVDGSGDRQELSIVNNGTGPANELEIVVSPTQTNAVTEIDVNSIKYTLNGSTSSLSPSESTDAYAHTCFTSNAKDGFTVVLPTIQPGESLVLFWDNYTCASTSCGNVNYVGWEYEAAYTDMCSSKVYDLENTGQEEQKKGFSTFYESPSDLVDGQEGTYSLIISSATFKLPEDGLHPYFEAVFNIPEGLVWNGGPNDLSYNNGTNNWTADQVSYNSSTRVLTAKYNMPIPTDFNLNHSSFDLKLTADCTPNVSWATVGMQLFYVMDTDCSNPYRISMTCFETPQTQLHCPGSCDHGMSFQNFAVARTSFGKADNDQDGLPDAGGTLDGNKIKVQRVMMSDTFKTTFSGVVQTSTTFPTWSYGYAESKVPYGESIAILSASVSIYDASTGATLTCNAVPYTEQLSAGVRTVSFDYSPATLVALGCSDFIGFQMEQDDEVTLIPVYKLVENIGGHVEQVMIQNEFYLSDTQNGSKYQCNDWNGNFTVIGYFHRVNRAEQYNIRTCTQTIQQTYKLSVGNCCTNYGGGNIFPYEYRNWSHLNDLRVEIPEGYSFVSGSVDQWRTVATNSKQKETASITPNSSTATSLYFNMEDYLVSNGGSLNLSDDGYHGKLYIELKPTCNVNGAANYPITWFMDFQESDFLGGNVTAEINDSPDYIKYYPSRLVISSTLPTQDGIAETVSWDIKVQTKDAAASNSWLYLEGLNNNIQVTELKDLSDGSILTPVNGFYQLGELSMNEVNNYQITATNNSCEYSELKVTSGHDCNGYPANLSAYDCASQTLTLNLATQPSELQAKFNNFINPLDECDNIIGIELEMVSSKLATVSDLAVNVITPAGQTITIENGSMQVLYPTSGTYATISNPVLSSGEYQITGADMHATIGNEGLAGVSNINANIVKLKFNILLDNDYQPGDLLDIDISGKRPCGDQLPTLSLSFDPNASFGNITGIGLDEATNNWATAWGDYDGDGYVDLFVTNYEVDEPNLLYHNDGDGTFTKITSGDIATDAASSLSASWGDYDNDGDLDLYVANNIGYTNFLYRNNGSGSFNRISNDPIVNDKGYAHGVSWVDYDRDGYLDMFVADYFSTKFNQLYHNNGDGTFTQETNAAPVLEANFSVSGVWGDYNNDGYQDLFVTNTENSNNSLYENRGDGRFLKINVGDIVNDGGNSVGASWGDYNNDGNLDLFVANSGDQNNFLYQNNGDATFTKITTGDLVNDGGHSHGSAWADYDNDGDLDLFVSNDQGQDNFLYSNNGDGTFTTTTNEITQDNGDSFGAGWADYDNDGDVDLFIANHNSNQNFIYENSRGKCQNKSCIVLEGSNTNRSAIGTRIYLKANIYGQSIWQMRELSGQTGGGTGGQSELKTIFGLGNATSIDSIIVEWGSGYRQVVTNPNINDCMTITEDNASEICGTAYYDANANCVQDNGEKGLSNIKLLIQPGNRTVMTDSSGHYKIFVEPGSYTISEETSGTNWTPTCTLEKSVTVVGIGNTYCGNDFSNSAQCTLPDLKVELSTTAHRVGFENLIALTYKNEGGADATNVALTVAFGNDVIPLESSIPWDLSAGTDRRWNFGTIPVGTSKTIYITDSISANAIIGNMISISATIYGTESDCIGSDNVFTSTQEAVGAIDPNDIIVSPEGFIDAGQELIYKIRFQNVGNRAVSTVRIEDDLPSYLDLNSFQQGTASHPFSLSLRENKLIWTFDNINMPDSTANEPESHGFVIFKIKTKPNLNDKIKIENTAAIYFDANAPVITNTVVNIIGSPANSPNEEGTIRVSPNPMSKESVVEIIPFGQATMNIQSVVVYDLFGRIVLEQQGLDQKYFQLQKEGMAAGTYLIRIIGENGDQFLGRVIMVEGLD